MQNSLPHRVSLCQKQAPVAIEIIKAIAAWLTTKENDNKARSANLKVKIKNKVGEEVEFDASNFSESETELIKKFAESLAANAH